MKSNNQVLTKLSLISYFEEPDNGLGWWDKWMAGLATAY